MIGRALADISSELLSRWPEWWRTIRQRPCGTRTVPRDQIDDNWRSLLIATPGSCNRLINVSDGWVCQLKTATQ